MYAAVDGRLLSVSMEVAAQITLLDIEADEPFEPFCICKRWNGSRGHPVHWDVWRTPVAEKARAAAEIEALGPPESELESQLRESLARVRTFSLPAVSKLEPANGHTAAQQPQIDAPHTFCSEADDISPSTDSCSDAVRHETSSVAAPPPWAQVLRSQTETSTDVYAASIQYASTHHGNAVKPEDVRALMTTAFINLAQRGRSRVA